MTITLPLVQNIDKTKALQWMDRLRTTLEKGEYDRASKQGVFAKFLEGLEFETLEDIWVCSSLCSFFLDELLEEAEKDILAEKLLGKNKH